MVEPLYQVKVECMHCEQVYQTSRVRTSFKKVIRTDSDFCQHYHDAVNPEFYVARVCPHCGFTATESFSAVMNPVHRQRYAEKLGRSWSFKDYGLGRSWEEALQAYKLALLCAQCKDEKDRVVAGLLHHIAWMYRYVNNGEMERRFLEYALQAYIRVFEFEGASLNNARLMFLIGELNRRLNNYSTAVKWFSRVIQDKKIYDAAMIRASRAGWEATREDMLADQLELLPELKEKP